MSFIQDMENDIYDGVTPKAIAKELREIVEPQQKDVKKNPVEIIIKAMANNNAFVSRCGVVADPKSEFEKIGFARLLVEFGRDFYHITIRKGEYVGD